MQHPNFHLQRCGPQLQVEELDELERRLHWNLPADYRSFLLQTNGGFFDPWAELSVGSESFNIAMFYQLLSTTDEGKGIYRAIFELNDAGINGYLPIACTTNDEDICFALREGECQVWIAHGIYENQIRVDATFSVIANDFASFVDAISQPEDVYCALEQLGISGTSADAEDFFQAGGTLNQLDKYDRTLLTVAIINGNVSVAEVCLRCGASTVGTIHSAVQAHQTEMIDLLLRYGASVNELDDCGYAPITYVGGTSLPGEDGERNRKLLEKLREFGAV